MLSETGLHIDATGTLRSKDVVGEQGQLYYHGKKWDAAVKWAADLMIIRGIIDKEIKNLSSQG